MSIREKLICKCRITKYNKYCKYLENVQVPNDLDHFGFTKW